ncbi:MAG: hypothetical protein GC186_00100 [Rhodobacteraceae bacterium]|nr:hypothetical protein [Paracoccaceae bacterium]
MRDVLLPTRILKARSYLSHDAVVFEDLEVSTDVPCGYSHEPCHLAGDPTPCPRRKERRIRSYWSSIGRWRIFRLGQIPWGIADRLGESETAMETIELRPLIFNPVEIAPTDVFVTQAREGSLLEVPSVFRLHVTYAPDLKVQAVAKAEDERNAAREADLRLTMMCGTVGLLRGARFRVPVVTAGPLP